MSMQQNDPRHQPDATNTDDAHNRSGVGAQGEGHRAPTDDRERATANEGITGDGPNRPAVRGNSDFANTGVNGNITGTGGRDVLRGSEGPHGTSSGTGKVGQGLPEDSKQSHDDEDEPI